MSGRITADGPLPYLRFCGVEISNAARVLSYLRNGLGDTSQGKWDVSGGSVCGALYRDDNGASLTYASPATDPAPWYDADEPGSSAFLGIVLLDLKGYDGVSMRTVTPRMSGLGGGSVGGRRYQPRVWKFRAALISANGAGAEYGLRWLESQLGNPSCDACSSCDIGVRLLCPPDDGSNDDLGFWTSYDTVLTSPPVEVEPWIDKKSKVDGDVLAGCRDFVIVEWEMTSANPWLYKQPQLEASFSLSQVNGCTNICDFLFGNPGLSHCITVSPPKMGTLGSVIMFKSNGGFGGVVIEGWESCPATFQAGAGIDTHTRGTRRALSPRTNTYRKWGIPTVTPDKIVSLAASSPPRGLSTTLSPPTLVTPADPLLRMELSNIPAGKTVVVDSAQRKLVLVDNVTGARDDASDLIVLDADNSIQWLEARDCDDIGCFCVRPAQPCATGDLSVSVYTQVREA